MTNRTAFQKLTATLIRLELAGRAYSDWGVEECNIVHFVNKYGSEEYV